MKDFLKRHIQKIIIIFLIAQPFIDCFTSISMNVFHWNITFGMIFRVCFLLLLMFYNLFIERVSKKSSLYTLLIAIYTLLFTVNILFIKDTSCVFYELKNLLRYLYFPLLLINLYAIHQQNPITIKQSTLIKIYLTYIGLILIPMITHTDFSGYFEGKVGTIGWFNSTNEISAILSGLLPWIFFYNIQLIKKIFLIITTIIVLFSLGSKITIAALLLTLLLYSYRKIQDYKNKKRLMAILVPFLIGIGILSIVLLPRTNFYKNIQIHLDFLEVESIVDVLKDEKLIDHFIFSSRLTFLKNTRENYLVSNIPSKLFGIGFIENYATDQVNLKTIEMDLFDIFYRLGIFGFILYLLPIFWVLSEKRYSRSIENKGSLAIFLGTSFLAGHVLTSPAVSIYLVILILNQIKEESYANSNHYCEL